MHSENYIYDQRQYHMMLKKIEDYFIGNIDANSVIIDIENLVNFLHVKDSDFIRKLNNLLLDIDINIYYLREGHIGKESLVKLDKEKIDSSMHNLKEFIKLKIDKNLTDEDVEYKN